VAWLLQTLISDTSKHRVCKDGVDIILIQQGIMLALPPLVLVAEDNEDIRELVAHQLRRMGVRVVLAEDGRRAVDVALAERPGLVLMDMDMPVMSGFDAVAALRAQGYVGPIFALTAYQDGPEAERALSSGCDALLGKPINSERLRRHVTSALGVVPAAR
jgi:CheY-like chemotaxis protein